MKNIETTSTIEIITELTKLEQEIDLKIMKYNLLAQEIYRRFPLPEIEEEFKPKVLSKGEIQV